MDSLAIICESSPIGRNTVEEAIRFASGIAAMDDSIDRRLIIMGDAVYFFSKSYDPTKVRMDPVDNIIQMAELSELKIYINQRSLELAGLTKNDLIAYPDLEIIQSSKVGELILNSGTSFKF
jgi:sulfur relay (sulfurtransferase) DsrF/TusC family protein